MISPLTVYLIPLDEIELGNIIFKSGEEIHSQHKSTQHALTD